MQGRTEPSSKVETELWTQVIEAWNAGRNLCHRELATQYTQKYPDNIAGWVALAEVLARLAQYDQATLALNKAQELAPLNLRGYICAQWGHFYKQKCDLQQAEYWYQQAAEAEATTNHLIFLGAVLAKQGKYVEAKQSYRQAIQLETDTPDEAFYNLGLILCVERKYREALECFERAIDYDPNYELAKKVREDVLYLLELKGDRSTSDASNEIF
jgi:tetratricopeptide (TPR) repeat protein